MDLIYPLVFLESFINYTNYNSNKLIKFHFIYLTLKLNESFKIIFVNNYI
jgi:hypothetical protein